MELSDFIKKQRKQHHLTQRKLADRSGVGLRFIREIESGKATLRMDKVNIVLELFGHCLEPVPKRPGQEGE
jgi:y4mF family transcriptional regulator